ncbi:uncharacterized protein LOC121733916 [Aricia agestis]|uniref:uncharacterized protein LOC121733916 n=1 Tax=Aricia agestis TaxID=91739 RepID=UPI001C203E9F|nr:uncharacterized protein LOC121733916 [Aricia agestis]
MDLSEPLGINHIEGGLVGVDYSLDDVVVSNLSKCAVKSLKIDLDSLDMNIHLDCPHLSMFGKYNVTGMIIAIFFEGLGETRIVAENYGLSIKGKLEEFIGEDDQKHVKVKNFIPKPHYGGKVVYNLTNLFYGNEMLATEAHKYINGNWKAVSEFGQAPIMSAALRLFFKNINKCLKPIPVQNIEF